MNNTKKFLLQLTMVLGWMLSRGIFKTVYFELFDPAARERALVEILVSGATGAAFFYLYSAVMKQSQLKSRND